MRYRITNLVNKESWELELKNYGHAARVAAALADVTPYRIDKLDNGTGGLICNGDGDKAEFVKI